GARGPRYFVEFGTDTVNVFCKPTDKALFGFFVGITPPQRCTPLFRSQETFFGGIFQIFFVFFHVTGNVTSALPPPSPATLFFQFSRHLNFALLRRRIPS